MSQERPFKRFFCDRRDTLKMPHVAFKIWMYHYVCEQDQGPSPRQSWPSVPDIMRSCGIKKRDTVFEWRAWLVDNGWLVKLGERPSRHGNYSIPIYRVTRGEVPDQSPQTGQSPKKVLDPSQKKGLDQSPKTGQEVEPFEVEPFEVDQSPKTGRVKIEPEAHQPSGNPPARVAAAGAIFPTNLERYLERTKKERNGD